MPVVDGYEICLTLCQRGIGTGKVVLFRRSLDPKIKTIFLVPKSKLVVLDVKNSDRCWGEGPLRPVDVYASTREGRRRKTAQIASTVLQVLTRFLE